MQSVFCAPEKSNKYIFIDFLNKFFYKFSFLDFASLNNCNRNAMRQHFFFLEKTSLLNRNRIKKSK